LDHISTVPGEHTSIYRYILNRGR